MLAPWNEKQLNVQADKANNILQAQKLSDSGFAGGNRSNKSILYPQGQIRNMSHDPAKIIKTELNSMSNQ